MRLILGLIKGAIVGGGVAYATLVLGLTTGGFLYVACALAGALAGLVAGKAPWRADTMFTPILKMIVGAVLGVVLAVAGVHFLPEGAIQLGSLGTADLRSTITLAPAVAILYALFVEVDDGGNKDKIDPTKKSAA